MPIYDYECEACGPFREMRPMSMAADPCNCPTCATPSPRSFNAMPFFSAMETDRRLAAETNERSSHEPLSSGSERARRMHGPNCSCCSPGKSRSTLYRKDGSKSFPSSRPWMISH